MVVLDANILIRAVLGRCVRQIGEKCASRGIHFYALDAAFADAESYWPALLEKRNKSAAEVPAAIEYFRSLITRVERDVYFRVREAIELVLEDMQANGEEVPDPTNVLIGSVVVAR